MRVCVRARLTHVYACVCCAQTCVQTPPPNKHTHTLQKQTTQAPPSVPPLLRCSIPPQAQPYARRQVSWIQRSVARTNLFLFRSVSVSASVCVPVSVFVSVSVSVSESLLSWVRVSVCCVSVPLSVPLSVSVCASVCRCPCQCMCLKLRVRVSERTVDSSIIRSSRRR